MSEIVLEAVSKQYRQRKRIVTALAGCSLRVEEGEFVSLLGPSGTGKTTVLNLVAGFEEATSGSVRVGGREVRGPGRDRAVVFQSPTLLPWLSALDNVIAAMPPGGSRADRKATAQAQLEDVGLHDASGRKPHEMSGGMQQRVGIARALVMEPAVLLMDEPFAALDSYVRREMQELVVRIHAERRMTTLFITHSVEEAIIVSDRIGIMAAGSSHASFDVPFDYPRDATELDFNGLRRLVQNTVEAAVRSERSTKGMDRAA
ncbi:MAG: transporter ATP-binding protein [Subtercola sp.]|nr:transporter ATP-binding protein [Subtercola sp.]